MSDTRDSAFTSSSGTAGFEDSHESDSPASAANPRPGRLDIGVISAGKVGSALASALRAEGHRIIGAYAASEASRERLETMLPGVPALPPDDIARASQLLIFAVPDDALAGLVRGLAELGAFRPGQIVLHTAGRYGAGVLAPAAQAGALTFAFHPAMTFTGTSLDIARLAGCPIGITGEGMYLPIAEALATEIRAVPVIIGEEDHGLYHAALAHGANHLVTLVAQAMRMLRAIGIEDSGAYLRPLLEASLDGALRSGEALLTGPVVRGDAGTVRDHREAIEALAALGAEDEYADIPPVYRALAQATANRAVARRVLSPQDAQRIALALGGEAES